MSTATMNTSVDRGLKFLTLAGLTAGGLNYLFIALMGRLLPPAEFVMVAGGLGILLVVGSAASATVPWLTASGLMRASANGTSTRRVARNALLSASTLSVLGGLGAFFASPFTSGNARAVLVVASVMIVMGQISIGWMQGTERLGALSSLIAGEVVVKVGLGSALALSGYGPTAIFGSVAAGSGVLVITSIIVLVNSCRDHRAPDGVAWYRDLLRVGSVRTLASAFLVVDVILVAVLLGGGVDAANYSLAMSLGRAPVFLAVAVTQAYLLTLARQPYDGGVQKVTWTHTLSFALPVSLVIGTIPREWLTLVGIDPGVSTYLPLAASVGLVMALLSLVTAWGQVQDRLENLIVKLGAMLLFDVVLIFVGSHWGVLGVGIGALAGGVLTLLVLVKHAGRGGVAWFRGWMLALGTILVLSAHYPIAWLTVSGITAVLVARKLFLKG